MTKKRNLVRKNNSQKIKSWMLLIAFTRFIYGTALLTAGIAIFHQIGKNLASEFSSFLDRWHIVRHFYYIHWLIQKSSTVSQKLLWILVVGNFIYALLAFVESAGLAFGQRWAYWLVILDTASFIPIEVYQICRGFNWINFGLLMFYIFSVAYLLLQLFKRPQLLERRP